MTDTPHNLVFNIERVDASDLRAQKKHDQREGGDLRHIDPSRSYLNRVLLGSGDPLADADAVIAAKGARLRKDNRAPYDRIVLSASRDLFRDPDAGRAWLRSSMEWLRAEYGPGLAYVVLHQDERTPHLHAVAAPLVDRGEKGWIVSHSKHPAHKGLNSYSRMRARAAAATGLDYGEPGGKPKAKAARDAEDALARAKREARNVVRRAEAAATRALEDAEMEADRIRASARDVKAKADAELDRNLAWSSALQRQAEGLGLLEQAKALAATRQDMMPKRSLPGKGRQRVRGE